MLKTLLPSLFLVVVCSLQVTAQAHRAVVSADEVYEFVSPFHVNTTSLPMTVQSHVVWSPGAPTLALQFDEVNMGENDVVRVQNPLDGETHDLTIEELSKWANHSGTFNSDTLVISVIVAPGSSVQYTVSGLTRGLTNVVAPQTICGTTDDRVPSADHRAARIGGCTIWLAGNNGCALTAGHCFSTTTSSAQFNVPLSSPTGALQSPPIADQFPVDQGVTQFQDAGPGSDWTVARLLTNNLGQTPQQRYGVSGFNIVTTNPATNGGTRVTGYGTTAAPISPTWNQAQKTHVGPYFGVTGTRLNYQTDTTGGNSGSPVINETTGDAFGIHTHGGCGTGATSSNSGTSFTNASFASAFSSICSTTLTAGFTVGSNTACIGQNISFLDASSGAGITSWAWDFDNNGSVDSTVQNPTYAYSATGTYAVTLTVSGAGGSDTTTQFAAVTVIAAGVPATLPYTQNFQAGLPAAGSEWCFESENSAGAMTAGASGTASPVSGSPSLTMATNTNNIYSTNSAILSLNLANVTNVQLTYWWKETAEEDHPEDGVFLSDGVNEVLAYSHQAGPSAWTQNTINVSAVATANGLVLNGNFQVIFRQRDNYVLGTDGILIDDISVTGTPVASPFDLVLTTTGVGDVFCQPQNVPAGASQGYTFFSFNVASPVGTGTFNGINPDTVTLFIAFSPAITGDLYHWTWPVAGVYPATPFVLPPGSIAPGLSLDGLAVAYSATAQFLGASPVRRIVW